MLFDSLYQVIWASGSQNDVEQVRFIVCPAITVTDVGVNTTDVTGTVKSFLKNINLMKEHIFKHFKAEIIDSKKMRG